MKEQIRKLIDATPFTSFVVDVAEEVAYSIVHPEHVWLSRHALVIEDDQGYIDIIPWQLIRRVRTLAGAV